MSKSPNRDILYSQLAMYYDQIYSWKDYASESKFLEDLILSKRHSGGNELLDVGCGTGKHLSLLRARFRCTGIDLSREMLAVARRKVKGVRFVQGDMSDFNLQRRFDVILCLFSAIAYVGNGPKLQKTLTTFSSHLKNGGIVIIQPWVPKSKWKAGHIALNTFDSDDVKIARLSYSSTEKDMATFQMEYLIAEKGKGIRRFSQREKMHFFERSRFESMMREADLLPEYVEHSLFGDRGLVIGRKRD